MNQDEVKRYVKNFFTIRDCKFIEEHPSYITVELNEETDRDLGYRPFYWSYIDKMGIKPDLLKKTYILDPNYVEEGITGEYLLFGSSPLRQIFAAVKKRGEFIRLFEELTYSQGIQGLIPWLLINYKFEYFCDLKKERLISIGFNLMTGEVLEDFYSLILKISLTPKIPAYHFTKAPIYSFTEALKKIEHKITLELHKEDHSWADHALRRLEEEKRQTIQYYSELMKRTNLKINQKKTANQSDEKLCEHEKNQRVKELEWQYKPRIEISTINQGILYLHTNPVTLSKNSSPLKSYI